MGERGGLPGCLRTFPGNPGCKPLVGAGREVLLFLRQPRASCLANLLVGFRCLNVNARGRNQS